MMGFLLAEQRLIAGLCRFVPSHTFCIPSAGDRHTLYGPEPTQVCNYCELPAFL